MDTQLELCLDGPYTVRFPIDQAIEFFWNHYWKHLPKGQNTRKVIDRIKAFSRVEGLRYVDEISVFTVQRFRKHLTSTGLKENTANTHHTVMRRWLNWLAECKEVGTVHGIDFRPIVLPLKNPCAAVPQVNEDQFRRGVAWTKKAVYTLVGMAIKLKDLGMAEKIEMLYLTGLRPGDLWNMTDKNVDLVRNIISGVQHKSITRRLPSGRPYLVTIGPRASAIIRRRMDRIPSGQPLFRDPSVTYTNWLRIVGRRFHQIRTACNMRHVKLCDFRPSKATILMDNGVDVETIRETMGWSTLRMLPVYARRTIAHIRRAQEIQEDEATEILV